MGKDSIMMPECDVPYTERDSALVLRRFAVGIFSHSEEVEESNDTQITSCFLPFLAGCGPEPVEVVKDRHWDG